MTKALLLLMMMTTASGAQPMRYHQGQVWQYHTRPGDEGSLLKIQQVEQLNGRTIFHITIIGVHWRASGLVGVLQHEPVSLSTLDQSVTEQRSDPGTFPSADEGIAEWRRAHGGVYTITVAQSLELADQMLAGQGHP